MTVMQLKEKEETFSGSDERESEEFSSAESTRSSFDFCNLDSLGKIPDRERSNSKVYKEVETDRESGGSSEEMESPKSVTKVGDWRKELAYVHYQIRRIREEDLHLGEDISEGFNAKEKTVLGGWGDVGLQCYNHPHSYHQRVSSQMDVVIFSRPILPSSPLSGKTTIRALN